MIDWEDRIQEAEITGYFTEQDVDIVGKWCSCAVGEMLNLSEDSTEAYLAIKNTEYEYLGERFLRAVKHGSLLPYGWSKVYDDGQKTVIQNVHDEEERLYHIDIARETYYLIREKYNEVSTV